MKGGISVISESGPFQTKIVPVPSTNPMCAFYCYGIDLGPTEITGFWIEGFVWCPDSWYESQALGILLFGCTTIIVTNNVITGNGVGVGADLNSDAWLRNNTLFGNSRVDMSGGLNCEFNIIWDRNAGACIGGFFNDLLDLSDSCLPEINFSQYPQFCGPSAGNLYLQSDSPCAPGISPAGILIGALPVGCATVKAEPKTWGAIKNLYKK